MKTQTHEPARLTDDELLTCVRSLAHSERTTTAELIAHLAEVEARRLYLGEASPSLFAYCVNVLHFSEHAAYLRIEAARAARRFPVILERLAAGDLHLTAVSLLQPILTEENCDALIAAARHRSRREIEELVALHSPQPRKAAPARSVPVRVAETASSAKETHSSDSVLALDLLAGVDPGASDGSAAEDATEPTVAPLAYRLHVTIPAATQAKLDRARDLMRHQLPDGDAAVILDRALDLLIERLEQRKFGRLKPRKSSTRSGPSSRDDRQPEAARGGRTTPPWILPSARRADNVAQRRRSG